jgi:hypothetical protein
VQSKQPGKPHTATKERNLAPLELIHSDLCEMNDVLTKGEKRYFMTLIDDATRFCYVYWLQTKDKDLYYFKIDKAKDENQLERKIKHLRSDHCGEYFLKSLMNSMRNTILFIRGCLPTRPNLMGWPRGKIACCLTW